MTDSTLQRVWDSREAISRRCDYDSRKLIHFYQGRRKTEGKTKGSKRGCSRPAAAGGRCRAGDQETKD